MVRFMSMYGNTYTYYAKSWLLLCFIITTACINCIAQKPELVLPVGHTDKVNNASFSPDGRYVVTSSNDHSAIIWEAATGTLLRVLSGHTQAVYSARFSTDGKKIVTSSSDHTVRIWDATTGIVLKSVSDPRDTFFFATFSPDAQQILTCSSNTIRVWDGSGENLLHTIEKPGTQIKNACYSPDNKQFAAVSGNTVEIWDAATGASLQTLKIPGVNSVSYDREGKQLQVITSDGSISIWDAATGKQLRTAYKSKDPKAGTATLLTVSTDAKYIAASFADNTVKIWDATTGTLLQTLKGHTDVISSIAFSPDGKRIASSSYDKTGRIWTTNTGAANILKGYTHAQWSAVYSPDGKYILTPSRRDSSISIWSAQGALLRTFRGNLDIVLSAAWSPDSKYIATSCRDNTIKTWDAVTGKLLNTFKGHTNLVWSVTYSPDGKYLASASNDKTAKIWDASSGKPLQTLTGHTNWVNTAAWSPDSKQVITSSWDGSIKIWTAATGALIKSVDDKNNLIWDASFSPDGTHIMAEDSWTTKVWETGTGVLVHTLQGGKIARYSTDGNSIVTGADDNSAKVWDATSGALLQTLTGHNNKVRSVCFSPDGKQVLTSSEDNTIRVWDAASGHDLFTFFSVKSGDYVVLDASGRFDGTPEVRKMIYFVCGMEVISLDQVKDALFVPHLAQKLLNGTAIKAKKISELDICDLLPEIEEVNDPRGSLYFRITPRRGGLGETVVSVNGIETKRYFAAKLDKPDYYYELRVSKEELRAYMQDGKENKVTVKAFTVDNDLGSRVVEVNMPNIGGAATKPTLYAIIIGINDSKDTAQHLKYAAKDAADMNTTVKASASKLLGADHVFTYVLSAGDGRYMLPERENIRKTIEEVGKKTKPNDILLIYFAGHDAIEPSSGQLYFLTNDAGRISTTDAVPGTDISAQELATWLHPSRMKAQKRVLVLDARNSGQTISNLAATASEDEKQPIAKALDKLNERSGLLIHAASAGTPGATESIDAILKKMTGK